MKTLFVLLATLASLCAAAEPPAPRKLTDAEFEQLLKQAERWGVPQPPDKSVLVKYFLNGRASQHCKLGFREPGITGLRFGYRLQALREYDLTEDVAEPEKLDLSQVECATWSSETNYGLITGIQLVRAGQRNVGQSLIERALTQDAGHRFSYFFSRANQPPLEMLALSCLNSALDDMSSVKPNFLDIQRRLYLVLKDQPDLKSRYEGILISLHAKLCHRTPKQGTIDYTIEEFLLAGIHAEAQRWGSPDDDPRERNLILLGFKAVPALLKQRHTFRATNHKRIGFNNFASFPLVSGNVINDYLQRLANNEFGSDWLDRQKGNELDDEAIQLWWERASALGEEGYVQKFTVQLVPDTFDENSPISDARISDELLLLAKERYPKYLPELYRKLLPTKHYSWPLLEPIMKSNGFSEAQKHELILAGIATSHEAHRNDALEALYELRPQEADAVLTKLLREMPVKVKISGSFDQAETQDVALAFFVAQSKDPKVRQEYLTTLGRVEPEVRIELIHRLGGQLDVSLDSVRAWQSIYDRFREDHTARDGSRFSFAGASGYPIISVRNFIHLQWNEWLKLQLEPPKYPGTNLEWETYRQAVDRAVKKELSGAEPPK